MCNLRRNIRKKILYIFLHVIIVSRRDVRFSVLWFFQCNFHTNSTWMIHLIHIWRAAKTFSLRSVIYAEIRCFVAADEARVQYWGWYLAELSLSWSIVWFAMDSLKIKMTVSFFYDFACLIDYSRGILHLTAAKLFFLNCIVFRQTPYVCPLVFFK